MRETEENVAANFINKLEKPEEQMKPTHLKKILPTH